MKAFLEYVLKNLVDSPESVSVQQVSVSGKTTLEVRVRPGDVGKVVGKQGQTIAAIRSIINAAAARYGGRVEVEIVEEDQRLSQSSEESHSESRGAEASASGELEAFETAKPSS
jgi:predicted RNA-binding protein YlqC (UPF0109 family)